MGPGRARPRLAEPPACTDGSPGRSCPAGARSHNRRSVRNAPGWAGPGTPARRRWYPPRQQAPETPLRTPMRVRRQESVTLGAADHAPPAACTSPRSALRVPRPPTCPCIKWDRSWVASHPNAFNWGLTGKYVLDNALTHCHEYIGLRGLGILRSGQSVYLACTKLWLALKHLEFCVVCVVYAGPDFRVILLLPQPSSEYWNYNHTQTQTCTHTHTHTHTTPCTFSFQPQTQKCPHKGHIPPVCRSKAASSELGARDLAAGALPLCSSSFLGRPELAVHLSSHTDNSSAFTTVVAQDTPGLSQIRTVQASFLKKPFNFG